MNDNINFSNIIFQTLISTVDGVGASTGKQTEEAFNENFALTKQLFEALFNIAAITVTSEQVTQIKADTTTTPYTLYYTTDSEEPITWTKIVSVGFADILGAPEDNIALKTALDAKGSASDVATLKSQMITARGDISSLQDLTAQHTTYIGQNTSAIADIQATLLRTVKTPVGDTLYLRYNISNTTIEYSLDGTTWVNINSTVAWGDITGTPSDSLALTQYVTNAITTAINQLSNTYATIEQFNQHTGNYNNPHRVTKEQLGLGNVDNYSAADMPLSTAATTALYELSQRFPEVTTISNTEFQTETLNNAVYLISSALSLPPDPVVVSVTIDPQTLTLDESDLDTQYQFQFDADVDVMGAAPIGVSWAVAIGSGISQSEFQNISIDSDGLLTITPFVPAESTFTFTVTATSTYDNTVSDTITVTYTHSL